MLQDSRPLSALEFTVQCAEIGKNQIHNVMSDGQGVWRPILGRHYPQWLNTDPGVTFLGSNANCAASLAALLWASGLIALGFSPSLCCVGLAISPRDRVTGDQSLQWFSNYSQIVWEC